MSTPALRLDLFDTSVRPQDDLYRHVNGGWLGSATIPDDKPAWGAFAELREAAIKAVSDIITDLAAGTTQDPDAKKIADLYTSYMDEQRIEELGATPLADMFAAIDAVTSLDDVVTVSGKLSSEGVNAFFGMGVDADPGDPTRYIMMVGQAGIGLPDEAYYHADNHASIREAYVAHIQRMCELAELADPAKTAELVMDLETKIAACHWDNVRCRDLESGYNPMTFDEFTAAAPELRLNLFCQAAGIPAAKLATLVNGQPSFFVELQKLMSIENLSAWKAWLRWRVLEAFASCLSDAFVQENFSFVGTTLSGTPELEPRWKRGVRRVESILGEAIGKVYVERHFSAVAKERMDVLVANLLEAYRRSIIDLNWMTAETKTQALEKLSKFTPKIGYPQTWRDYSDLAIIADDLVGNMRRAAAFELADTLRKAGGPIDRDEWLMYPQTVNAYYHPLRNEIVFPAAILQPPFFNVDADDAINYGGIGGVIGHEIGHGFDDQGSTCDGDGRLRNWWTAADKEAFTQRTSKLIAQYDALEPEETPGIHVNGSLTIGENIGDLGGLSIALKAWRIATEGQDTPDIDGLTGEQRLFFAWATVWQQKTRAEAMKARLATDPHSPNEFRANQIVRNIDDFYTAFGVTESDQLWLDPADRVSIW
ncbi:MAG: M13 family metallopeptidase [Propionibacteriaceae bacterium]